jgi:Flp pilus assembly protein TadG
MPAMRTRIQNTRRRAQRGAVIITMALVMLLLLGFIGAALDFGRLFVIKTELQTALDSCALSAAAELDAQPDALTRAVNAGLNAGNQNRVDFQSANWAGLGQLTASEITFRDAAYTPTASAAQARYAQCQHTQTGSNTWLLQALGAFSGNPVQYPNTRNVAASAVATRGSAQTTCPVPLAIRPKPGFTAPNYGFTPGEWVTLLTTSDSGAGGYIGWANLDGSNSASETTAEMNGHCGVTVGTTLGTPGVQTAIVDNWNWRFGIYKNGNLPTDLYHQPDLTGYAYTTANWPSGANAYDGPVPPGGTDPAADNFVTKRRSFANCINTTTVDNQSLAACANLINRSLNGMKDLLPGGASSAGGHRDYGGNRRIVTVPVTNGYPGSVADYVCMLMLQPLSVPMADVQLEFIGNAAAAGSPCVTSGLPGGSAGPLVPVLVR